MVEQGGKGVVVGWLEGWKGITWTGELVGYLLDGEGDRYDLGFKKGRAANGAYLMSGQLVLHAILWRAPVASISSSCLGQSH